MKINSIANPRFITPDNENIFVEIQIDDDSNYSPHVTNARATGVSAEIYLRIMKGEAGAIAEYVSPPPGVIPQE